MAERDALSEKLKALRDRFSGGLANRVEEVRAAAQSLVGARDADTYGDAYDALMIPVHKLAGSSTPMGHPILGSRATQLEARLRVFGRQRDGLNPDEAEGLNDLIEQLAESAGRPGVQTDDAHVGLGPDTDVGGDPTQLALMLATDRESAEDLALQVGNFGYALTVFTNPDDFEQAARHIRSAAVIIDLDRNGDGGADRGLTAMDAVSAARPTVPIVALTARTDIVTRLRTVRAGAAAVLSPPVDAHELVQTLDRCTEPRDARPYRILIVEDDADMAFYYELLLQGAGMDVHSVTDPMEVIEPLSAFEPDLILMDVNMPNCTGIELASVIRQNRAHVQIPIVFLTADTSALSHLFAVRAGGDDYLIKPVDEQLLIASVRARAERARLLTSLISSDSMTGLLNHSSIMEALATELARAQRAERSFAFAMIDIDHFKAVNDTYGHWVGDTVIKALAQVLRQRLRKTDVIGRYGGEEFAVILSDVDAETAARLVDRIRDDFTKIRHRDGDNEFFVTFSCGIATYPQVDGAANLTTVADEALYEAKSQGRNRVVIADVCR